MNSEFFIGIVAGLLVTYLAIGYYVSQRLTSVTDYIMAGRSLGIPAITATLLAAQVGGGMFLGTAADPFRGFLYIFGIALGLLVLGLGLASKLQSFKVTSIGEIFETTYASITLHHLAAFLSILSFVGILISQILAARSVLLNFAGIESELLFIIFWLTIVAYTMIGGFQTVIVTDFFRIIFIIVLFTGICLYSIFNNPLSFFNTAHVSDIKHLFDQTNITFFSGLRLVLLPLCFCLIEQDLAQKFFAARTKIIAGIAALYASLLLLLFAFVPVYFGIQGAVLSYNLNPEVNPLLPVLQSFTNDFFFTIAVCGLLSAITSTTDSLLCAVSSIFSVTINRIIPSIKPTILLSRLIITGTGLFTLGVSYFISKDIINVMVGSYEISVSCLLVPFIAALVLKKFYSWAAYSSVVAGMMSFLFFKLPAIPGMAKLFPHLIQHINPYAQLGIFITLFISLISYGLGHWYGMHTAKQ